MQGEPRQLMLVSREKGCEKVGTDPRSDYLALATHLECAVRLPEETGEVASNPASQLGPLSLSAEAFVTQQLSSLPPTVLRTYTLSDIQGCLLCTFLTSDEKTARLEARELLSPPTALHTLSARPRTATRSDVARSASGLFGRRGPTALTCHQRLGKPSPAGAVKEV